MIQRGLISILALMLLLLVLVPTVSALSLAGQSLGTITYMPGVSITNHYSIFDTDKPVEVLVDGGILSGISVSDVVDNEFDLIIDFPQNYYIPPGSYNIGLTVREVSPAEAGISSQVAVSKSFEVIVYSYDKDIQASLYAANINQGKNVTFQLSVQSMGYPDIEEVYAKINILNSSRDKVGGMETLRKPLPGLEGVSSSSSYDTQIFPSGSYYAEALIFYDGKYKTANTTFLIGIMDLILNNYTTQVYQGFNDFEITVTNGWGNELRNVYAKLLIDDGEIVQTPGLNLGPWQQAVLATIVNIEQEPGTYNAALHLYFEAENKEIPIELVVLPPLLALPAQTEKELQIAKVSAFIPAILSSTVILFIMGVYLLRRKKTVENEL